MIRSLRLVFLLPLLLLLTPRSFAVECRPNVPHPTAEPLEIVEAWALFTRETPSGFGQRYAAEFLLAQQYEFPEGGSVAHKFDHLDLRQPYLEEARLSTAYFFGSRFRQGNLAKAQLCHANLQLVDFDGSTLVQANISNANLQSASFGEANLLDAVLDGTVISNADLRQAKNLTQAQVDQACYEPRRGKPQLPDNLRMPPACLSSTRWQRFDDGIEAVAIHGLAVHPDNADRVAVLTGAGLYTSSDGGATWTAASGLPADSVLGYTHLLAEAVWPSPHVADRLFAAISGRLYRSDDFGSTWQAAVGTCPACTRVWNDDAGQCIHVVAGAAVHPIDKGVVLAGTIVGGGEGGVFRSENSGGSWAWLAAKADEPRSCPVDSPALQEAVSRDRSTPAPAALPPARPQPPTGPFRSRATLPNPEERDPCEAATGMGNDGWPLAIDPKRPKMLFAGGPHSGVAGRDGLKRSMDGGQSWSRIVHPEVCREGVLALIADPKVVGGWLVAGAETWATLDDGESWSRVDDLGPTRQFVVGRNDELWAVSERLWRRDPHSRQWSRVDVPAGLRPGSLAIGYQENGIQVLYLGTKAAGLHRRVGDGPWVEIGQGLGSVARVADLRPAGEALVAAVSGNGLHLRAGSREVWRPLGPRLGALYADFWLSDEHDEIFWASQDGVFRWRSGDKDWLPLEVEWGDIAGRPRLTRFRRHPTVSDRAFAVVVEQVDERAAPVRHLLRFQITGDRGDRLGLLGATQLEGYSNQYALAFPNLYFNAENKDEILLASWMTNVRGKGSGVQRSLDGGVSFKRLVIGGLTGIDRSIHQLHRDQQKRYFAITGNALLFELSEDLATATEVPTAFDWNDQIWAEWLWGLDTAPTDPPRFLARDWHDWRPEPRPPRVRYAIGRPTSGNDWREISDDGLPPEAWAQDQAPPRFAPWDPDLVVLPTYDHGLWARRLPE